MPTGSMHSKLQLLKFPNYLRLVIPTGNLVPYDVSIFPFSLGQILSTPELYTDAVKSPSCRACTGNWRWLDCWTVAPATGLTDQ